MEVEIAEMRLSERENSQGDRYIRGGWIPLNEEALSGKDVNCTMGIW